MKDLFCMLENQAFVLYSGQVKICKNSHIFHAKDDMDCGDVKRRNDRHIHLRALGFIVCP
jgi:hypothetical protein